jgi:hypothetical protein
MYTWLPGKYMLALIGVHGYSSYNTTLSHPLPKSSYGSSRGRGPPDRSDQSKTGPTSVCAAQRQRTAAHDNPKAPERFKIRLKKVDDNQWKTNPLPKRNGPAAC